MPTYSGKLMDHFLNPLIEDAEGVGKLSSHVWGIAPACDRKMEWKTHGPLFTPGSRLSEAGESTRSTEEVL